MPSTTTYRRGQVVVVTVPFTGQGGAKLRPAVVVSAEKFHRRLRDVIVSPISSQPRYFQRPGPGDLPLSKWASVGLRFPSTARLSNILAVEKSLVRRILGRLAPEDLRSLDSALLDAFGLR
ncbi:MAG TPA: type II toxin-antitoxin system PemK/MazF family toxin [Thermoanaerobaculia bacterium]|nr:type II toxin-antitoxin system PemK/MazF family toxin [Thermoanaerobaculia bacterium]